MSWRYRIMAGAVLVLVLIAIALASDQPTARADAAKGAESCVKSAAGPPMTAAGVSAGGATFDAAPTMGARVWYPCAGFRGQSLPKWQFPQSEIVGLQRIVAGALLLSGRFHLCLTDRIDGGRCQVS